MRVRRKIRITLTQERAVSVRVGQGTPCAAWCPGCAEVVAMLTPDQAAIVANVSTRHIYRWLESNRLHFVETDNASPLVCLGSLSAAEERWGSLDRQAPGERGQRDS